MLTGESVPVKKMHELSDKKITAVYDAYTLGYAGTVVVDGDATGVIFATGQQTEMGSIAQLATKTIVKSALTKGTTQLAEIVLALVVISLVLVLLVNIFFKIGTDVISSIFTFCRCACNYCYSFSASSGDYLLFNARSDDITQT